uniref:LicD/FKTN/FKRP nucleotidyltransferase domain-containing protein n=1 Tax=Peronospora matthiolae TaxID=2874970 RepID=A0AAV1UW72_9STRA
MKPKRPLPPARTLALVIAAQLLLCWLFLLAARLDDVGVQAADDPSTSSTSLRRCISAAHRDRRYVQAGVCVTVQERAGAFADLLYALKVVLENAHVVYWIDSGTLLGVYRAQQLVPWDYNVDIGITVAGLSSLRSMATDTLQVTEGYELTVFHSPLHEAGETSTAVPVRFVDTTFGFYANVFAFAESQGVFKDDVKSVTAAEMENDVVGNGVLVETLAGPEPSQMWQRCVHCPVIQDADDGITSKDANVNAVTKQFRVPRDWLFPLRICKVEQFEVKCPAQTAPYLMYIFGNRFLTPELWD